MGKVVRFPTWRGRRLWERASPTVEAIRGLAAQSRLEQQATSLAPAEKQRFPKGDRIHRSTRGDKLRSKSEVAIADILYGFERERRLTYYYEERLPFAKNPERWCDFLILARGAHWYWEHCGMLHDEDYRQGWEHKKAVYAANGYTVYSQSNPEGRLIFTADGPDGSLDMQAINQLAWQLFFR